MLLARKSSTIKLAFYDWLLGFKFNIPPWQMSFWCKKDIALVTCRHMFFNFGYGFSKSNQIPGVTEEPKTLETRQRCSPFGPFRVKLSFGTLMYSAPAADKSRAARSRSRTLFRGRSATCTVRSSAFILSINFWITFNLEGVVQLTRSVFNAFCIYYPNICVRSLTTKELRKDSHL